MSTESFDFKIREKLEEISADLIHLHSTRLFDNLVMNKNWQSKPVTRLMFFDMITYTSMGDQDLAIDGLRVSEEMLDEIDNLLWVYDYSTRMKIILPEVEPRIHFALNCGAKSCPPIKTFSGNEGTFIVHKAKFRKLVSCVCMKVNDV